MVMESKRLYTFPPSRNGLVSTRSFHLKREKHGVKNCSLGTATQRGGDPKIFWCLSTNSSNGIQQSKLSGILEFLKGFSRLKHDETKFNLTLQQKPWHSFSKPKQARFPWLRVPYLQTGTGETESSPILSTGHPWYRRTEKSPNHFMTKMINALANFVWVLGGFHW